ncbi:MAG: InlB B-repeat-containing protein, partial [Nitrososphaerota archaeon]|nr:InlB B-repeat-containing protein [Nitrososphaerota archaeon]
DGIPVGTTGKLSLLARWSGPIQYTISYELDGGINAPNNPVSYNVLNGPIGIADPSMTDCTFLHWIAVYADGSSDVLPSSSIAAGTTGDINLIAVWSP